MLLIVSLLINLIRQFSNSSYNQQGRNAEPVVDDDINWDDFDIDRAIANNNSWRQKESQNQNN